MIQFSSTKPACPTSGSGGTRTISDCPGDCAQTANRAPETILSGQKPICLERRGHEAHPAGFWNFLIGAVTIFEPQEFSAQWWAIELDVRVKPFEGFFFSQTIPRASVGITV